MLTDEKTVIQVTFDEMKVWPLEYRQAVGELIIACSQWEHVYELLCKDLNITTASSFVDQLAEADEGMARKQWLKTIKGALASKNNSACNSILKLVDELEAEKPLRHRVVHGFHFLHEGQCKVTHINSRGKKDIAVVASVKQIMESAAKINSCVNVLNKHRRQFFHAQQASYKISAAASTVYVVGTNR
jgi:hypothetical protein